MNLLVILKEVKSPALKEVIKTLDMIVEEVRNGEISYQKATVEIVGLKHILQSIALDWAFNRTIKRLVKIGKDIT